MTTYALSVGKIDTWGLKFVKTNTLEWAIIVGKVMFIFNILK